MSVFTPDDIVKRRRLEDILRACGQEREWLEYKSIINRGKVRALLAEAREAGITVREIARMTGLSAQTLHTWMRRHMRPVPEAHLGFGGPPAATLEEAVLRTIAETPTRDWQPDDVLAAIPVGWPRGSAAEVGTALEILARCHYIWDAERGYRLAPPEDIEPIA
jgi:lambda repressor-like predicted transcriptional regulator